MAKMRMSMRKIREVLRLTHELGLSVGRVCEATGVGKTAVSEYVSHRRYAECSPARMLREAERIGPATIAT
jgi:predicted transcriptional regulator